MRRILTILLLLLLVNPIISKADEGMWIPMYIEQLILHDMQELGLELNAEQIFSLDEPSISDAIVIFGGGCTGEIVSDKGLLLTNHHCGYGSIQRISTVQNDYLTNGFWAESFEDEIPVPGLTVRFLVDYKRVTDQVLEGVMDEMTEKERNNLIDKNKKAIVDEATNDNSYIAGVRDFYEGNEFYLLMHEIFRDIRLVGTPPEAIGKFGADTDNWMWPRQTGDFSFFRVYADSVNKAAEYSTQNVPFKPKHFLPISIDGIEKGDFTMIMGYPGRTDRYLSSWGVKLAVDQTNMTIVNIREEKLRIMREGMDANEKTRLQYASKYSGVSNYWKYYIGQTRGLKRLKVADKKETIEAEFSTWLEGNPGEANKYGEALSVIEDAYHTLAEYNLARIFYSEAIARGSEILFFANRFNRLSELLADKDSDQKVIERELDRLKRSVESHFKNYDIGIDRAMLASMLEMYHDNVPAWHQPPDFRQLVERNKNDFNRIADRIFSRTSFSSADEVSKLLDQPKSKHIRRDPAFELVRTFNEWHSELNKNIIEANEQLRKGNRLFMAGLLAMNPHMNYYPNANSTMRITYGTVQDYFPADAVHYNYFTTTNGILEKEDPSKREFEVPDRLKEIIASQEYGPYGNTDGTMTVNFLTNHDITGGNSGSPVINGKGHLVGLAFDGNWEAMSGDIAYEAEVQRTISVDARYILLIVDKFANARRLINEMKIVGKSQPQKKEQEEEMSI